MIRAHVYFSPSFLLPYSPPPPPSLKTRSNRGATRSDLASNPAPGQYQVTDGLLHPSSCPYTSVFNSKSKRSWTSPAKVFICIDFFSYDAQRLLFLAMTETRSCWLQHTNRHWWPWTSLCQEWNQRVPQLQGKEFSAHLCSCSSSHLRPFPTRSWTLQHA